MRREFYRYPEISGKEFLTGEVFIREIESMGFPYRLLDSTGIIAVIQGGKSGKNRVVQKDIGALPVQEVWENLQQKIVTQMNSAFVNQLNVEETVTLGIGVLRAVP